MELINKIKSKSFGQWCVENNRQDILNRWDYELNKCKPSEISYGTQKKYYFKCPLDTHQSEFKKINNFTNGHQGSMNCIGCNSFAQWGIDHLGKKFLEKYWSYEKNIKINPWEISFSSHKEIYIECQEKDYHESYLTACDRFVRGDRCPYCKRVKVHLLDSLGKLLEDLGLLHIWSEQNKKSPYKYSPMSHIEVYWKCVDNKHKDYFRSIKSSNQLEFRCPDCIRERKESFLQEKVRLYLESLSNNRYTILHENKCTIVPKNPKTEGITNNSLPFDNEIKELKLIIEIHGEQHYRIDKYSFMKAKKHNTTPKYELHYQQLKDRYKRMYSKSKGYDYLAIPYWTDNAKEEWKVLINNKINNLKRDNQFAFSMGGAE